MNNIYGIEIKGKIYNLCFSNMLINTGNILPNFICSDSIRKYQNIKVDNIIANPPFSVNINYNELLSSLGSLEILNNYIPIKTGGKNSEVLFSQMMIHCLNINGKCATVMLDGHKLYGSTSCYDKVREYLMKSCDLQEVIYCPSGTFISTGSKTCILFFIKKKERNEVIEITGSKRILKFCDSHCTNYVKFYNFNNETEEKIFIKEVPIEEIAKRKYSLNYNDYEIKEIKNKFNINYTIKTLGEVCLHINGLKKKSKDANKYSLYPLYYCLIFGNLYLDTFDYDDEGIIINKTNGSGKSMVYYACNKYNIGESVLHFKSKNKEISTKYIYYYLLNNIDKLEKYYKGCNQKSITEIDLNLIEIPIPTIKEQEEIIKYCEKNDLIIQNLEKEIEENKILAKQFIKKYFDNL